MKSLSFLFILINSIHAYSQNSPEYLAYKSEIKEYRKTHGGLIIFASVYTAAAIIAHVNLKMDMNKSKEMASYSKMQFENSTTDPEKEMWWDSYRTLQTSYESDRMLDNILIVTTAAVVSLSTYYLIKHKDDPRPVYKNGKVFSRIDIGINPLNTQRPMAFFAWRF